MFASVLTWYGAPGPDFMCVQPRWLMGQMSMGLVDDRSLLLNQALADGTCCVTLSSTPDVYSLGGDMLSVSLSASWPIVSVGD